MKTLKLFIAATALLSFMACNPIEDLSLREKYVTNAGSPISSDELSAALTVSQDGPTNDIITLKCDCTVAATYTERALICPCTFCQPTIAVCDSCTTSLCTKFEVSKCHSTCLICVRACTWICCRIFKSECVSVLEVEASDMHCHDQFLYRLP